MLDDDDECDDKSVKHDEYDDKDDAFEQSSR